MRKLPYKGKAIKGADTSAQLISKLFPNNSVNRELENLITTLDRILTQEQILELRKTLGLPTEVTNKSFMVDYLNVLKQREDINFQFARNENGYTPAMNALCNDNQGLALNHLKIVQTFEPKIRGDYYSMVFPGKGTDWYHYNKNEPGHEMSFIHWAIYQNAYELAKEIIKDSLELKKRNIQITKLLSTIHDFNVSIFHDLSHARQTPKTSGNISELCSMFLDFIGTPKGEKQIQYYADNFPYVESLGFGHEQKMLDIIKKAGLQKEFGTAFYKSPTRIDGRTLPDYYEKSAIIKEIYNPQS